MNDDIENGDDDDGLSPCPTLWAVPVLALRDIMPHTAQWALPPLFTPTQQTVP